MGTNENQLALKEQLLPKILQTLPKPSRDYVTIHQLPKIKDYDANQLKNLNDYLIDLCEFVGISAPTPGHVVLIISFLKENFGDFSKQEIERAMNLALSFKFDIDSEELKHYGKLTPQWISLILTKYRKFRGKELVEFQAKLQTEEQRNKPKPTPEQMIKINLNGTIDRYVTYSESGQILDFGNVTYNWLTEIGALHLTKEQKKELLEEARQDLIKTVKEQRSGEKNEFKAKDMAITIQKLQGGDAEKKVQANAKRLALKHFFDNFGEEGEDLENYLKNKINIHSKSK